MRSRRCNILKEHEQEQGWQAGCKQQQASSYRFSIKPSDALAEPKASIYSLIRQYRQRQPASSVTQIASSCYVYVRVIWRLINSITRSRSVTALCLPAAARRIPNASRRISLSSGWSPCNVCLDLHCSLVLLDMPCSEMSNYIKRFISIKEFASRVIRWRADFSEFFFISIYNTFSMIRPFQI